MREKARRRMVNSDDKCFALSMKTGLKRVPHCEWNGTEFSPTRPKPSPRIDVNVSVMHAAHKRFGINWTGSHKGIHKPLMVEVVADSGCQTCSAGIDVLQRIGCPESYLVPTNHRIAGITNSLLDIAGSVFLRIEVGGRVTRQMVHVSKNTHISPRTHYRTLA